MLDINDYKEEKSCIYKGEEYLVRDNGAILRKSRPNQRKRKLDDEWTFGTLSAKTGYLMLSAERIHRIVALAFHGEPPSQEHVVDHIDTNRQNNRPRNLRWVTRLENVVLNEATRKKIEYRIGVSIYEFLKNPAAYRDAFDDPDFRWMRQVTEKEAEACLNNVRKWAVDKIKEKPKRNTRVGEWIFRPRFYDAYGKNTKNQSLQLPSAFDEKRNITDSLTPLAKQMDWVTPTSFLRCPKQVVGNPIDCYLKNLSEDSAFSENQRGESKVVKFAAVDKEKIFLITTLPSSIKPLALVKITYENGSYLHTNMGSFFSDQGAEKQFVLAQGLEWHGGNSIDDYC